MSFRLFALALIAFYYLFDSFPGERRLCRPMQVNNPEVFLS